MLRPLLWALCILAIPAVAAETHVVQTIATGDPAAPYAFSPATTTIQVGDTVQWLNADGVYHTTTSSDGAWDGVLGSKDASYSHRFTEAGTFAYRCNPHAEFMTATIVVEGEAPSQDSPSLGWLTPLAAIGLLALRR